jgi:F-type H+-transporting ATPase subunit a
MLLAFLVLFFLFRKAANSYILRKGQAPKGVQAVIEPLFEFIRNEVAIPFLGSKYEKYLPYLMSVFFFILGLNLIGQLPFFPGSGNVTGNLSVTLVLAVIAALVTNFGGNKSYWQHIFNMPGVPLPIKFILTPVELLGLFIKPMTLMLRLFANITAGHIVIIIFVSLIFIFGEAGESLSGSILGGVMAVPLTLFMMAIELLVAFVQAFVFCILTASYIGAAIEEHHEHH